MIPQPPHHKIPSAVVDRILAFLRGMRTGQIALNIHDGRIMNIEVKERIHQIEPE